MQCLKQYKQKLTQFGENEKQRQFIMDSFTRWFVDTKLNDIFPVEPIGNIRDMEFAKQHHGADFAGIDIGRFRRYTMEAFEEFQRCAQAPSGAMPQIDHLLRPAQLTRLKQLYTGTDFERDKNALIHLYEFLGMNNMHLSIPPIYSGVELFGSPLNTHNPEYCSPFPLERKFGSLGSFFEYTFHKDGLYLCNPPFDENVMERMAQRLLDTLDKTIFRVEVVITIPVWDSESQRKYKLKDYGLPFRGFELLKKSKVLHHTVLDKYKFPYYNYYTGRLAPATWTHLIFIGNQRIVDPETFKRQWLEYVRFSTK